MMDRSNTTREFLLSSAALTVGFLFCIASHGEVAAEQAASASGGWGAKLESEAEFAYRSVYERSLSGQGSDARTPSEDAAERGDEPPGVPVRKPKQEAASAKRQIDETVPTDPPGERADNETDAQGDKAQSPKMRSERAADDKQLRDEDLVTGSGHPPYDLLAPRPWFHPIFGNRKPSGSMLTTQVLGRQMTTEAVSADRGPRSRGEQYCSNIADAAAEARFVWQKQTLLETEKKVKERIEKLQARIAEYKKWLERRNAFSRKAQSAVTDIYAKMRPEAAARQLAALDEETAAAVVSKLKPRIAGAVMAEMDAQQAARLTAIISASSRGPKGEPPAQTEDRGT